MTKRWVWSLQNCNKIKTRNKQKIFEPITLFRDTKGGFIETANTKKNEKCNSTLV